MIPVRLEEVFILLSFLAIWIYYFGIKEETKIKMLPHQSITTTVCTVLILSGIASVISFAVVNMILTHLEGIFP